MWPSRSCAIAWRSSGYGPPPDQPPGPDSSPDAPDYSFDTPGRPLWRPRARRPGFSRTQRAAAPGTVPADALQLNVEDDLVTISAISCRRANIAWAKRLSRLEEYGTAVITASFSHELFMLKSNYTTYTSHAQRIDTYEVDPATGALTVTEQINDPTVGKILLHSVYRRS